MLDVTAFAALIKRKRGEARLTQETLALDVFGDSARKADISRLENARVSNPQEATVQKICSALNISSTEMEPLRRSTTNITKTATLSLEELQILAARFEIEEAFDSEDSKLHAALIKVAERFRHAKRRVVELEIEVASLKSRLSQSSLDSDDQKAELTATLLSRVFELDRYRLVELAILFGSESAEDLPSDQLREFLRNKNSELIQLKAEVDAIPDKFKKLDNLKAAAQDALHRVDLDEVENLMSMVHEAELEEAAKSTEIRANNALLRGELDKAYALLFNAAHSFESVDQLEPSRRIINNYSRILYQFGIRYGGPAIHLASQMLHNAVNDQVRRLDRELWAAGQDALATMLRDQGSRVADTEGADFLAQAVTAYRKALDVRTSSDHPEQWAMTQNNLAVALQEQGIRTRGPAGADLFAKAVTVYRNALEVRTRADRPVDWAMTQNNLAIALSNQGTRTDGSAGADLLAQAVTAYRNALELHTRTDHPVQWAMTQNNLAVALQTQGTRTEGPAGADLLALAVTAYDNALEVRTRADHPVDWAMTQENIAIALKAEANHDSCTDSARALTDALAAVNAALTVFDPEHMSYNHGTATRLRDDILAQLNALS